MLASDIDTDICTSNNCSAPTRSNGIVFHLFYSINSIIFSYDPAATAAASADAVAILRLLLNHMVVNSNLDVICVPNRCKKPIRNRLLLESMQSDGLTLTLHFFLLATS